MRFEILSSLTNIETIAFGTGVRDVARLRRKCGKGRWRKMKGIAKVKLIDGRYILLRFIGTKRME